MKVLVTGATGFLGGATARRIQQLGHHVVGLGRNEALGRELQANGIEFLSGDLTDEAYVARAIEGMDIVIHTAALSSPWGREEQFYKSNVVGTRHVIGGACKAGIKRLVHISTPSLYFRFNERLNVRESDALPTKFVNAYAATKYQAEQLIDQAFQNVQLPVVTLRPRAIFGPEDTTILPRLIETNRRRFIPLMNGGQVWTDLTYIDNVVDAILLATDAPVHCLGQKYNITNGEPVQLRMILERLFEGLQEPFHYKSVNEKVAFFLAAAMEWSARTFQGWKEPLLTRYTVSVLAKSQTLNIDKATDELGYQPRVSTLEGLEKFVEWWKEEGR